MTTISDRLAAALVALEEAATDHTTAPGVLALCTAARAWTRVADEVDGYVDPDAVTKGRAQAISDYEILRTRTDADIAALQDEVRRLDDARSSLHARAEAAERDLAVAKTEAWRNDRRADEHMADLAAIASHLKCGHVLPAVKAAIDALRNKAETAECRVSELEAEVNSRANEGHELFKQRNAAQDRVAELTKPGSATDDVFPVIWRRAIGVPSDAGHFGPRDIKAAREIYSLGLAHGRAEQAARVAELEAETRVSDQRLADLVDKHKAVIAAWQAATGAATPGGVRRLTPAILRGAMFSALPGDADGASDLFRALTAPGPVVLPGATPSDEEIARDLYDALTVPGAYDDIAWSVTERRNRDRWTAAVASVVRPLLARPAQTSAGGDLAAIGELERDRDAQAAEVARATANARLFARAADTEKGNAAGFKAEVARLAGVARDACDVADELAQYGVATACLTFDASGEEFCKLLGGRSATVRAAIPTPDPADDGDCTACGGPSCACVDDATPDPAVFVAAVERYGAARSHRDRLDHDADEWRVAEHNREHDAARAALLALRGAK